MLSTECGGISAWLPINWHILNGSICRTVGEDFNFSTNDRLSSILGV